MSTMKSLAVAATILVSASAFAKIQSDVTKSINVKPGGTFQASTSGGDIVIRTADTQRVDIVVQRIARTNDQAKANEIFAKYSVVASQVGDTVRVEVKRKDRSSSSWFNWNSNSPTFNIIATVPKQFHVNLTTSGGDIHLADLKGNVVSHTSGGDVEIGSVGGSIKATTSGGDISLRAASGSVMLSTSGGDIKVDRASGTLDVSTSGGDIKVQNAVSNVKARTSGGSIEILEAGGTIDAETSGGNIIASFSAVPRGNVRLDTSGGNVRVTLPSNAAFELDADTSSGDVMVDFPIQISKKTDSSLRGTVNGGGIRLELTSSAGDVTVSKR